MERAELKVILRFPSMKMHLELHCRREGGKLLVSADPGIRHMVGCTSGRMASRELRGKRGKKDAATERQARFGNEEMVFPATGSQSEEISENAREREDNNKSGAHLLAPQASSPVPHGSAVQGPQALPGVGLIYFFSQSPSIEHVSMRLLSSLVTAQ